jgi:hypothetical protein
MEATSIAASAGDQGYDDWDVVSEEEAAPARPDTPASLATVVAVGGTSLKLEANGARESESVWNDSGRPSHPEEEFKQYAATGGGTSLSSPLTSSLYALAGGSGGVSYPAATLYGHLGQAPSLYDVTEGGNGYCDGEAAGPCGEPAINKKYGDIDCEGTTACDAATGYDGPSGVGAPKGLGEFKSKATSLTTQTTATLSGRVNPDGQTVTKCKFEYGTSTSYGSSAPCKTLPGSGTSPVEVSAKITGLTPNTEYHFRFTATNAAGTSKGADVTFKTS